MRNACVRTLDELGLPSIDLYLVHSPVALKFTGGLRDALEVFVPRDENTGRVQLDPSSPTLSQTWRAMVCAHTLIARGMLTLVVTGIRSIGR